MTVAPRTGIKAAHRLQVVETTGDLLTLQGKRFHLIGIGGVGMSALARVLLRHASLKLVASTSLFLGISRLGKFV